MKKHTSGVSRLILDWSNGALKTKHLKDQSSRAAPVRKLSQVRHSLAKNAVCKKYKEQLNRIGFSYDWDREIRTTDPSYYKWTQWIFLKLYNSYFDKKENVSLDCDVTVNLFSCVPSYIFLGIKFKESW